ncbi:hypothetical protein C0J52_03970 [Blattella germanica]|nr:hypothetical protein C0J52_03970 [Blattella germanica]
MHETSQLNELISPYNIRNRNDISCRKLLNLSLTVALLSYATKQLTCAPACLPGNAHRALCPLSHQLGLHGL